MDQTSKLEEVFARAFRAAPLAVLDRSPCNHGNFNKCMLLRVEILLRDKKRPLGQQTYLGKWHVLYPHETLLDSI